MSDLLYDALAGFYVGQRVKFTDVNGDVHEGVIRSDNNIDERWGRMYEVRPDDPDVETYWLTLKELQEDNP